MIFFVQYHTMEEVQANNKQNSSREYRIMVVDDEPGSRESIRMILKDRYSVAAVDCPEKALDLIAEDHQEVDVVFSDIRMVDMDGIEFLQRIKNLRPAIEVIMITAYPDSHNTISALKNGASDYILKPFSNDEIIRAVQKALARRDEIIHNQEILLEYQESIVRNYEATTSALISTIDAKDHYTYGHSERVAHLMVEFSRRMNFDQDKVDKIRIISFLHDIGKIGTPENILNKEGPLTKKEYEEMRRHSSRGYKILQPIEFLKDHLENVLYHHERFDGKGYPEGLAGFTIPVEARMLAIVDAYDAMTTTRPYRQRLSMRKAISELKENAGTQFDPKLVQVFLDMLKTES